MVVVALIATTLPTRVESFNGSDKHVVGETRNINSTKRQEETVGSLHAKSRSPEGINKFLRLLAILFMLHWHVLDLVGLQSPRFPLVCDPPRLGGSQ